MLAISDRIGGEIAETLGIKHCKSLVIRMHSRDIVTVTAEIYPEIDGVRQWNTIFKQYELVEKPQE